MPATQDKRTDGKETLQGFRDQIDVIDDQMLQLLAKRNIIVRQVGALKSAGMNSEDGARRSIIRPGREANMVRRVAEQTGTGFSSAALALLWRLIISSAMNIEEDAHISTFSPPANREAYWLAREYFGAFTKFTERPTAAEVLRDVCGHRATVAVLPLKDDDTSTRPWWSRLTLEGESGPKIFARLPFIQIAPSKKPLLTAIGYVTPEATSEDETIYVLEAQEKVIFSMLEPLLKESAITYEKIDQCRVIGVPNLIHTLLRLPGFIPPENEAIQRFITLANEKHGIATTPVKLHYLGAYATPILFDQNQ